MLRFKEVLFNVLSELWSGLPAMLQYLRKNKVDLGGCAHGMKTWIFLGGKGKWRPEPLHYFSPSKVYFSYFSIKATGQPKANLFLTLIS